MLDKLDYIRIVLVNTSHPGNIGSTARAMKTMGLTQLYLVQPVLFPHAKANEMAVGADDILLKAVVVNDLSEAIADCGLVVGTSARSRTIPWPVLHPKEFAERAVRASDHMPVAILFGREQSGLTNQELQFCHFHLCIPTAASYSSLNLAAAVQVIAYELRMASLAEKSIAIDEWDYPMVSASAMAQFYEHLEQTLIAIDFLNPEIPRQLMTRLKRLFNRARLDSMEMNILRGILTAINARCRKDKI